jgi:hypothetical protein
MGSERRGVNLMPESLLFQRCTLVSGRTTLYCRKSTKTKLVDFQTPTADLREGLMCGLCALKGEHLMEVLYARWCGLDVHRSMLVACVSIIEAGHRHKEIRRRPENCSRCVHGCLNKGVRTSAWRALGCCGVPWLIGWLGTLNWCWSMRLT